LPDYGGTFVSAHIKYHLVSPVTNANYPLSIDGGQILSGTVAAARLPQTKYQIKTLTANATSNGTVAALGFSNLEIGKTYRVSGQFSVALNTGAAQPAVDISIIHNSATIVGAYIRNRQTSSTTGDVFVNGFNRIFVAAATSLSVSIGSVGANDYIVGSSNFETFLMVEELPTHTVTTDWT
jgi:hypothetical protein